MDVKEKVYVLTHEGRVIGQYAGFLLLWGALQEQGLAGNLTEGQLEHYMQKYAHMRFQSRGLWFAVSHE
jgi:hypothetical protein